MYNQVQGSIELLSLFVTCHRCVYWERLKYSITCFSGGFLIRLLSEETTWHEDIFGGVELEANFKVKQFCLYGNDRGSKEWAKSRLDTIPLFVEQKSFMCIRDLLGDVVIWNHPEGSWWVLPHPSPLAWYLLLFSKKKLGVDDGGSGSNSN